ncbi:microcin C ABC transporter permease YejB [Helicobacter sp. 11S02629-2]|uniref:microcin C ABC transporter permease YejB n=1 Tax=Helicobacter sp. 11S02629-2 TaxID=1476195 RepID=UPI000BA5F4EC|nr:microcin C ABC transporter permease YejB [Helicobacter sp. 11S02629-2]PAF43481.1 microcin ABC transporter permease [Helicobacter sp. 11S02629-2]
MFIYILKRLGLVIPTLIGIIAINFFIIQVAPGGPIEQMTAKLTANAKTESTLNTKEHYKGTEGVPPELIAKLKKMYGFDKPLGERFWLMLKNYATLNFGDSFYSDQSVISIIKEKLPVSITLGVFSTLIIYLVSIPLGILKSVRNGTNFDSISSFIVIILNSIPAFLFAVLLIVLFAGGSYFDVFPLKGLTSDNFESLSLFGKIVDYLWHIALPIICICIGGFATLTLLVKNSFLDELGKQYVVLARSKGASEKRILYFHVFRNAMLLVVSLFPTTLVGMFFSSNLMIEIIFSLDGLGLLGFDSIVKRDYPVVFGTLFIFTLVGLIMGIISDVLYTFIDPRINFDKAKS